MRFTIEFIKMFLKLMILLSPIWGIIIIVILTLALIISVSERLSLGNALYFALITAMTVGYGDIVPVTSIGKITAVLIAAFGILATGVIVAIALQAVRITYEQRNKEKRD